MFEFGRRRRGSVDRVTPRSGLSHGGTTCLLCRGASRGDGDADRRVSGLPPPPP